MPSSCVGVGGGDEHGLVALVAQRHLNRGALDRLARQDLHRDHRRVAGEERLRTVALGLLEPHRHDLTFTLVPAAPPVVALHACAGSVEVELVILPTDLLGLADVDDLPALEEHGAIAEPVDRRHVVRDEEDRASLVLHALELLVALLLEGGVAHGEHLVDDEHVGVDLDRGGEGQPDMHARRVVLELEVDELLELREREDLVEARDGLAPGEPEHRCVDDHVVARRQLRIEADAELDEGREPAATSDRAGRRARRSRPGTSAACSCRCRSARRCRRTRPRAPRATRRWSARSSSYVLERNGCSTRSLSVDAC